MTDRTERDANILALYREDVPRREIAERCETTINVVENVIKLARKLQGSSPQTGLLRYDAARQALAEARSYDEVREWEDKAAAIREYARRSRNRALEIDAAEIRVRAERRRGELLAEMRTSGVLLEGRRKKLSTADDSLPERMTLADLDTTADESSRAQKLAAITPDAFERLAARCRERLEVDTHAHAFDVLRERDGPVNGARSVMGSREQSEGVDYFPTPPFATRALIERVFPHIGVTSIGTVWEPACGEGHMSGVLEEYPLRVVASDILDYSQDGRSPPAFSGVMDFLTTEPEIMPAADWIITNPPFEEKAEQFVLKAIERANVGVAMFFRLQWLETVGRFERIFQPYPPVVIAQFAERVPLHEGRWEPDGSTATAYVWIVWIPDRAGPHSTEFFWIPPGCRNMLTKPTDRDRFTAHPVLPLGQTIDGEAYDPSTGEIEESQAKAGDEAEAFRDADDRVAEAENDPASRAAGNEADGPRPPSDDDSEIAGPKVPYGRSLDAGKASTKASSRETEPARTSPAIQSEIATSGPDTASPGVPEDDHPAAEPGGDEGSVTSSDEMSTLEIPAFLRRQQAA